jgi:hypothetical protein
MTKPKATAANSEVVLFIVFLLEFEWSPHIPEPRRGKGSPYTPVHQAGSNPGTSMQSVLYDISLIPANTNTSPSVKIFPLVVYRGAVIKYLDINQL